MTPSQTFIIVGVIIALCSYAIATILQLHKLYKEQDYLTVIDIIKTIFCFYDGTPCMTIFMLSIIILYPFYLAVMVIFIIGALKEEVVYLFNKYLRNIMNKKVVVNKKKLVTEELSK